MPNPYADDLGNRSPIDVIATTAFEFASKWESLDKQAPLAEGKWSIHQLIAHLADSELVFHTRLRFILFEDHPLLPGFDQDKWSAGWSREVETYSETFERFTILRTSTVKLVVKASPEDMQRTGYHLERGPVSADDVLRTMAGHDLHHLKQFLSFLSPSA